VQVPVTSLWSDEVCMLIFIDYFVIVFTGLNKKPGFNPTNQKKRKKFLLSLQIFKFLKLLSDIWYWIQMEEYWRPFSDIQLAIWTKTSPS
jgi:hypothetical protein